MEIYWDVVLDEEEEVGGREGREASIVTRRRKDISIKCKQRMQNGRIARHQKDKMTVTNGMVLMIMVVVIAVVIFAIIVVAMNAVTIVDVIMCAVCSSE